MDLTIKKKFRKKLLFSVLLLTTVFGLARVYYRLTDDFRMSNMTHEFTANSKWEHPPLGEAKQQELIQILQQPYTYLGKGAQIYAFSSADGEYVLKFFKFKHLRPDWYLAWLPQFSFLESFRNNQIAKRERKLDLLFSGYQLGYASDQENTGLLYVHLNPKESLGFEPTVMIQDKLGFAHVIDLRSVVFALQKKGNTLRTTMKDLLNQGDVDQAKIKLNQIIDMYVIEYQKGIWDRDHGVMHNTGFEGEKPFHLDVGKLSYDPKMKEVANFKPDLLLVTNKILLWISNEYPQYLQEITDSIESKLSYVFEATS